MSASDLQATADILVVDDERVVCASCERILGDEGHRVTSAQDPREGLRIATETRPDIAIVDLKMPEMDGIEFLARIKEVSPSTEVMIITGFAEIDTAVKAMKLGAFDYVPKPFSPDQLVIAVAKMQQRQKLQAENQALREELQQRYHFDNIVGRGRRMQEVFRLIERVAPTESTVLIRGESGTGKELVARAIHFNSPRKDQRFVAVDCGALSESVLESEFFGHVKGAFTGAATARTGFFGAANGGSLFLDEIGNVSLQVQVKLLRVLQERAYTPVGSTETVKTDIRLIAATNRDLEAMVKNGEFREDLYYRLNIVPIEIPSLRERREDIADIAMHFLEKHREATRCEARSITPEAIDLLMNHAWPGNVRELENVMERTMVLCVDDRIAPRCLPIELKRGTPGLSDAPVADSWEELKGIKRRLQDEAVSQAERAFLLQALAKSDFNITRAAESVGMLRPNFQALMKKHGITRPAADGPA